jgi:phosphomannomutase
MVTASHNPKQDNGFKVYNSNGSQIIPPYDTLFAASIDKNLKPWQSYDTTGMESHPNTVDVTDTIADAYFSSIPSLCDSKSSNGESPINAVYTAMHGVGNQWVKRAFDVFGHKPLVSVPSQSEPDPTFPTVVFPNPEEKGALNESIKFAESTNSTLIIANDPDADRLAVAEMQGDGTWHTFSGNEIGVLLGYWQIQRWRKQQSQQEDANSPPSPAPALLASVVSSRMLKAVAKAEGCLYQDTLTGFKWLGDAAVALRKKGVPVIFSYEEALGYCLGDVVVDKDGVTAAAVFLEMATSLKKEDGRSVFDHLQFLYSKYGEFRSFNSYVISHDAAVTEKIFARLRTSNQQKTSSTDPSSGSGVQPKWKNYWSHCVGVEVRSIIDVTKGFDSTSPDGSSVLPLTPESHMIMFEFANGVSVTLRTSGTEPKIKWYSEIAGAPGVTREQLDQELHSFVGQLVEEMLQPQEHGLGRA